MTRFAPLAQTVILAVTLTACGPSVPPDDPMPVTPAFDPTIDRTPGFNEREPDTCHAAGLQNLIGQPSTVFDGMALQGPLRVIAPNEVFDQEEYRSNRIDVRIDGAGTITSIACG